MAQRRPDIFRRGWARWMMKRNWGKKVMFFFFGKQKDKKNGWPAWVVKTDEERCQNMPWLFPGNDEEWIATEKVDGTSTTFTMKDRGRKQVCYVCSRNVVFDTPEKGCYYDTNVYFEMFDKYNIKDVLTQIMDDYPDIDFVTIQGETYGEGIQKRNYNLENHCFKAFNLIFGCGGTVRRFNPIEMTEILTAYGVPCVDIVDEHFKIPETCDELLIMAEGKSMIDGGMREGLVFRSTDGRKSFKAVSNPFLLKYHS
jgi:RNA ligase (TIGR02306 family)